MCDVIPKVLKLSSEVSECKPLDVGGGHAVRGGAGGAGRRGGGPHLGSHGRAMHVDPINRTLNPPGTKRLILKYDEPLSC